MDSRYREITTPSTHSSITLPCGSEICMVVDIAFVVISMVVIVGKDGRDDIDGNSKTGVTAGSSAD